MFTFQDFQDEVKNGGVAKAVAVAITSHKYSDDYKMAAEYAEEHLFAWERHFIPGR